MVKTVIVQGKKMKVPIIVATDGPFILVRRLTIPPKALGIEFVVKRKTRFGDVLVSSLVAGKTKEQGMKLLRAAAQLERFGKKSAQKSVELAKKAGIATGRGLIAAGRVGFRLVEKASRPRKRTAGKGRTRRKTVKRKSVKRRSKKR